MVGKRATDFNAQVEKLKKINIAKGIDPTKIEQTKEAQQVLKNLLEATNDAKKRICGHGA